MIIVDASVFNKLFLDELDKDQARAFFKWAISERKSFGAPRLIELEIGLCALHFEIPFSEALSLLDVQVSAGFQLIEPTRAHWLKAEEISRHGDRKAGFPTLIDSLYHAAAILEGGVFLTADRRHVTKTADFGRAVMLEDWRTLQ